MILYYTDITKMKEEDSTLILPFLSQERRDKIDKYYFPDDKKRSICAELLLKYCVKKIFGDEKEIILGKNKYGKPYCFNLDNFYFNISHSGKWVVIAAGESDVGIDVEEIKRERKEDIIDCFSKEEMTYVKDAKADNQKERFIHIWSMKESFVKYIGTGLYTNFDSFCVNPKNGEVKYVEKDNPVIKSWLFDNDYYMSICCQNEVEENKELQLEDLYQVYTNGVVKNENCLDRIPA